MSVVSIADQFPTPLHQRLLARTPVPTSEHPPSSTRYISVGQTRQAQHTADARSPAACTTSTVNSSRGGSSSSRNVVNVSSPPAVPWSGLSCCLFRTWLFAWENIPCRAAEVSSMFERFCMSKQRQRDCSHSRAALLLVLCHSIVDNLLR